MDIPNDLKYTSDHQWVRTQPANDDGSVTVTVGITAYATDALGGVVYLDLPELSASVEANKAVGEVESTKSVSDIYAPVTGTVTKVHTELVDELHLINAEPYGQGWMFEIEVADVSQLDGLLDAAAYGELTGE